MAEIVHPDLVALDEEITRCRACPRLVEWREEVGRTKRAAFRDDDYWARPVPGFGDPVARVVIVGLAPAAHGANRTGRMFTGDRSGDFLYASLFRTKFANQPLSVDRHDGLQLEGAYITAPVRCAPPANKPTPAERDRCLPFLRRELALLRDARVLVPLGQFAYQVLAGEIGLRPRPRFAHGLEVDVPPNELTTATTLICSYHVSQQNTFTKTLTPEMLDAVLGRARQAAGLEK